MNKFKRLFYRLISVLRPDVKRGYELVRRIKRVAYPVLPTYRFLDHQIMVDNREIPIRVFAPDEQCEEALLFFYGGGWVSGDIDSYTGICNNMANETGRVVISVDYRLAPEHPFPKGLNDCFMVYRALIENPWLGHINAENITLIGDSAGGNLAAALSLKALQEGIPVPKRQILLYPSTAGDHSVLGGFPSLQENASGYGLSTKEVNDYFSLYMAHEGDRLNPLAVPLLAKSTALAKQPKTLVITAEFDPLRDEGAAYGEALRAAGVHSKTVCIKGAVHGFIAFPKNHEVVVKYYEEVRAFLGNTNRGVDSNVE